MSSSVGKSTEGSRQSAKSVLDTLNLISTKPKNNVKTFSPKSEPVKVNVDKVQVAKIHQELGKLGTKANSVC